MVAYSASNLVPVAAQCRDRHGPAQEITIVADHDASGIGRKYADQASAKYNCRVIMPPIAGMDANDYLLAGHDLAALLTAQDETKKRLLTRADDLMREPVTTRWLIKGVMEAETLGLLFGESGSGKSFVAISQSCCIATGTPWFGRRVTQGPVVYVCGEGYGGVRRRLRAWELLTGISLDGAPLYLSRRAVRFLDSSDIMLLSDEIAGLPESPDLIVIDTLARAFAGGDENSTSDASRYISACDALKERFHSAALSVHHSGHATGDRSRGSSAFKAAMDHEFKVAGGEAKTLSVLKSKEGEIPAPIGFELVTVDTLWRDEDGDAITSAVAVPCECEEPRAKSVPMTASVRYAVVTLHDAIAQHGDGEAVHVDAWEDVFKLGHAGDKAATIRQKLHRAKEDLSNNDLLIINDDFCSFGNADPAKCKWTDALGFIATLGIAGRA
jgi:hypothetical protein